MKTQIATFMAAEHVDALLVKGDAFHNPAMVYLTGGGHVTNADLILPQAGLATLICNDMERDEAAKTGLKIRTLSEFPLKQLLDQSGGNTTLAIALRYKQILTDLNILKGRVALFGQIEIGPQYAVLEQLAELMPDLDFVGYYEDPILMPAMMTKDPQEIERIRNMGKITTEVVGRVQEFLTSRRVINKTLVDDQSEPITIRKVKSLIDLWLAELGAENPEGAIFAMGRDAGVPHSSGNPVDTLRLGETIVFDIFPCESGGGYFYDFTRTWSLGFATDAAQELFDQVYDVYKQVTTSLRINTPFKNTQKLTCDLFEAKGHPTLQSHPGTHEGYVHSIGHGVGLRVHELPFSGASAGGNDILVPNCVVAIEPGLYYPSKNMGFRIENTFWAKTDGSFEALVDYPTDFVLPMR